MGTQSTSHSKCGLGKSASTQIWEERRQCSPLDWGKNDQASLPQTTQRLPIFPNIGPHVIYVNSDKKNRSLDYARLPERRSLIVMRLQLPPKSLPPAAQELVRHRHLLPPLRRSQATRPPSPRLRLFRWRRKPTGTSIQRPRRRRFWPAVLL